MASPRDPSQHLAEEERQRPWFLPLLRPYAPDVVRERPLSPKERQTLVRALLQIEITRVRYHREWGALRRLIEAIYD